MKKSKFQINVSDLLISGGKKDEITFENENLEELENLSKDGISGTVIIQSFDNWSLLVNLENLTCTIVEPCDKCTESYSREVFVPKYQAKFQIQIDPEDDEDDETYLIENENIDIQEMILNAIRLEEPFSKLCTNCTKDSLDTDEDDEDEYESFWLWNVQFR